MEAELAADKNCRSGPQARNLHIESPLDIQEDVAAGAFNYNTVKHHFKLAYQILKWQAPLSKSILAHIISDKVFIHLANTSTAY